MKRYKTSHGYIKIYVPYYPKNINGYIYEHIYKMEKKIGRPLKKGEIVHHIDKNGLNNKISNLYLCENQSEHKRIHNGWKKIDGEWWKMCNICKEFLLVKDNFWKRKTENYIAHCKKCVIFKQKKWWEKNKKKNIKPIIGKKELGIIKNMTKLGFSSREIAKKVYVSKQAVLYHIRKNNYEKKEK